MYVAQNTQQNTLLACFAKRLSAFTSMCETDTAGRGSLKPPLGRRRLIKAIWPRIPVPRSAYSSCRRYLCNKVEQRNGVEPIYMRLTCRPSTLKMINISKAPNAMITRDEFERCTTWVMRVLQDVSCSSCSLSHLLVLIMAFFTTTRNFLCVIRSSPEDVKQNNRNLACYWHNSLRKNLGLLGQSLPTKTAIISGVAIRLVICIMYDI